MRSSFLFAIAALIAALSIACGPSSGSDAGAPDAPQEVDAGAADSQPTGSRPRVILMIGDGMGRSHIAAATSQTGGLFMSTLPHHGELATASLSGITDSAAAATAMATGKATFNSRIGTGPDGEHLETLVELARERGYGTGIVTTSYLSHATPAAFTAHRDSRHDLGGIAVDQSLIGADIMFGGGAAQLAPHYSSMESRGYSVVTTAAQMQAADGDKVLGVFADEHLDYVLDRPLGTAQPTLSDMSIKALDLLEASDRGFFLMIEGARIDMASHDNDFERAIAETIAFDQAVRDVAQWAEDHGDVLLLVTADHECGGLELAPDVSWRWGAHTNARVDVFGKGPGSSVFAGEVLDHRWVHAALRAELTGEAPVAPADVLIPDGNLADLSYEVATQTVVSDFGVGLNQLDGLLLDADERGLAIGVEGLFEWGHNAVVVLIDVDLGAGTGHASLLDSLTDSAGLLDSILSSLRFTEPPLAGFGADLAVGSVGGAETHHEDLIAESGARDLNTTSDLGWSPVATNFGEGVRTRAAISQVAGQGFEAFVPWSTLYPELSGGVPPGATIAVAVVLVNDDGGYSSNQVLPPFAATVTSPMGDPVSLPGVVQFVVDGNLDGIGDAATAPMVLAN